MTYSRDIGAFRHASNPAWGPAFPAFRKSLSFRPTGDHRGIPLRGESNAIHEPCLDPSASAVCLATCVAACVATRPMPALHAIMPGRCGYHVDGLAHRFDHRISTGNSLRYRDPCVRTHRIVDGPSAGLRFQDSPHSNGRSAASRCGMSGYVAAARIRCIPGQIDGPRRRDDGAACALLGPAALRKVRALFRQTTHGLLRLRVLQMPGGLQRS
jgi:hypothetical protein